MATSTTTVLEPATATEFRRRIYNPLQKDYVTFLKTAAETAGEHTLIEIELAPGGGNTAHYHRTYEEHFHVLEGRLLVHVDGVEHQLGPGESAVAPRNAIHFFRNAHNGTTRFQVTLRPASAGFEKGLTIAYGLASDGLVRADGTPKSLSHLALLIEWTESGIPGVLGVLQPLFGLIARRARRKGIDRELERRYLG